MSAMDKKQRKSKKREEKKKAQRIKAVQEAQQGLTAEDKSSGKLQIMLVILVAILGAAFIIFNV